MNTNVNYGLVNKTTITLLRYKYCKTTAAYFSNRKLPTTMPISKINKEKQMFRNSRLDIFSAIKTNVKLLQCPEVCTWVQKIFDYNTSGHYKVRGLSTVFAYKLLETPYNITEEKMKLARIAGWTIEMCQAYIIMLDDVMDGSTTRRGKPCWYRIPEVGLGALNDSTLIYCTMCDVLEKYFGKTQYYPNILHLINESLLSLAIGQYLDSKKVHNEGNDYAFFTIKQYKYLTKYKWCAFGLELPIFTAQLLTQGKTLPTAEIKKICFDLGTLFHMQNDILDCYGGKSITGKEGKDIQGKKCTWLAVQAIQRCNPEQRAVFTECYGSQDTKLVERIKSLYDELHLLEIFREEENKNYENIMKQIQALPADVSPSIFYQLLDTYEEKSLAYELQ